MQPTDDAGMRKASFADMNCSIVQALEIVGEWWTPLIVRDALLGIRRFDDFVERLGIARNVLASRLDTLVAAGILERHAYELRAVARHECHGAPDSDSAFCQSAGESPDPVEQLARVHTAPSTPSTIATRSASSGAFRKM